LIDCDPCFLLLVLRSEVWVQASTISIFFN
jgi:hypothetical protein